MDNDLNIPVFRTALVDMGSIRMTDRPRIKTPADAEPVFRAFLEQHHPNLDREVSMAAYLDHMGRVIKCTTLAMGDETSVVVSPPILFRGAIECGAASIILCHNHVGDNTPSAQDHLLTSRMQMAGKLMNIPVIGHVVIGRNPGFQLAGPDDKADLLEQLVKILGPPPPDLLDTIMKQLATLTPEKKLKGVPV